jgi:hypothetical protein
MGMSVTITLSFRSTEYRQEADGGDFVRDAQDADMDIFTAGFAFAQIQDMEAYYADLKASGKLPAGAVLNVTGYSLGSHLATVFTELHTAEINQTTIFNGAGRGDFNTSQYTLQQIQDGFWDAVGDLESHQLNGVDVMPIPGASDNSLSAIYTRAVNAAGTALPAENIYADPRYQWALQWTKATYGITNPSSPGVEGLSSDAAAKITQLYGHGTHNDVENVANSGVHASDPIALNGLINAGASPSLRQAILDGNRAEAWYQIRYGANGDKLVLKPFQRNAGMKNYRHILIFLFELLLACHLRPTLLNVLTG